MIADQLRALAVELRALKARKQEMEQELSTVDAQIKEIATQALPEAMEKAGLDKFRLQDTGETVYIRQDVFAYVKAEDRDRFHEWLKAEGLGDLVKETVHSSTLKSWAKEWLSEGKATPDFVSTAFVPTATMRKGN